MNLCLVDGYGFVFRAFHSLPPLTRADGVPINAVLGFTNMLLKFIANHESDCIAIVLDSGKKTFRHDIFPLYKANRPEPPQELIMQFPIIREVIEAFNLVVIEKEGYEADDLIASYALKAERDGMNVKVVSSDKDLMQLVSNKISLYDAMKDKKISFDEVKEKFGVTPKQVKDALALIGDSSDNIPGVRGIGPKTASELINQFGSLDNLYANLDQVKNERQRNLLITEKENAFLSKVLLSLKDDMSLDYGWDELKVKPLNNEKLFKFLEEQGFKTLLARLSHTHNKASANESIRYIKLNSFMELKNYYKKMADVGIISILILSDKLEISSTEFNLLVEFQLPAQHDLFSTPKDSLVELLEVLSPILTNPAIQKILYSAKPFIKQLHDLSIELNSFDDVGMMAYIADTKNQELSLKELVNIYLGEEVEINSHSLLKLFWELQDTLVKHHAFTLYSRIEQPLLKIIAAMEIKGVKVDAGLLKQLSSEFNQELQGIKQKIWQQADKQFNIASNKQLGEVLFDELKLPLGKKSKVGNYGTGADILEQLSEQGFEIADSILSWRHLSKLINTYTEALPKSINLKTGRIHTTFQMMATSTGRLSSIDPNLQNIPIRSIEGQKIRSAFVASNDNTLISADYSQIELRLLAHVADVKPLQEAFKRGEDIHAATAMEIFGISKDQVNAEWRRKAKAINFGIIYGQTAFGLAKALGIPKDVAKKYIDEYFNKYPGIKAYMNASIEFARTHGYMMTLFGRKCHITGINDKNFNMRGFAERAAINAPLQGTAADIIKKAMVMLPKDILKYMILQVHDELLFEIPEDKVDWAMPIIKKIMENVIQLSVPIIVDIGSGKSWDNAH